jgi:phage regulator Rha-like protein
MHETTNQIVTMDEGGVPTTTTLAIAEGCKLPHASVIKLVRTYRDDLEIFGRVRLEIRPFETSGGIQSREFATLNERQTTLLLIYMKNSPVVREFKKSLVNAFFSLQEKALSIEGVSSQALATVQNHLENLILETEKRVFSEERMKDFYLAVRRNTELYFPTTDEYHHAIRNIVNNHCKKNRLNPEIVWKDFSKEFERKLYRKLAHYSAGLAANYPFLVAATKAGLNHCVYDIALWLFGPAIKPEWEVEI